MTIRGQFVIFAEIQGNIATGVRMITNWPLIVNLKEDPYEKAPAEAVLGYFRWMADNMWLFVPIQKTIQEFLASLSDYPFQEGVTLNPGNINYQTLKAVTVLQRLKELNALGAPNN